MQKKQQEKSEKKEKANPSMMGILLISLSLFLFNQSPVYSARSTPMIVDHNSVAQFSQIPDSILPGTINQRTVVRRASVGGNIRDGLIDLYNQNHKYDFSKWNYSDRGNPGWQAKITDLVNFTANYKNEYDVFSMKLCYIDQDAGVSTVNINTYINAMEQLEANYPNKIIVWWTMPLMTGSDQKRNNFNNAVRAYAQTHNKILFDIAAVESGNPGVANETMMVTYTNDGGHLNPTGRQQVAKAWWVLMARLAGWNEGGNSPTPSPSPSPTARLTPTPTTRTPSPTPSLRLSPTSSFRSSSCLLKSQGDASCDGNINDDDYFLWLDEFKNGTSATPNADFNNDGKVDLLDFEIWRRNGKR